MDDIENFFKETIAEFMENGLEAEFEDELGLQQVRLSEQEDGEQPERSQRQNAAYQPLEMWTSPCSATVRVSLSRKCFPRTTVFSKCYI